jgi:hypothetical protein
MSLPLSPAFSPCSPIKSGSDAISPKKTPNGYLSRSIIQESPGGTEHKVARIWASPETQKAVRRERFGNLAEGTIYTLTTTALRDDEKKSRSVRASNPSNTTQKLRKEAKKTFATFTDRKDDYVGQTTSIRKRSREHAKGIQEALRSQTGSNKYLQMAKQVSNSDDLTTFYMQTILGNIPLPICEEEGSSSDESDSEIKSTSSGDSNSSSKKRRRRTDPTGLDLVEGIAIAKLGTLGRLNAQKATNTIDKENIYDARLSQQSPDLL